MAVVLQTNSLDRPVVSRINAGRRIESVQPHSRKKKPIATAIGSVHVN
jgi:hypothetical protein